MWKLVQNHELAASLQDPESKYLGQVAFLFFVDYDNTSVKL